ncbi:virB8 family protein [uncultured Erythrobacter sp.]|uniref:virB8 family protein n=1 Tax=uncultured Erythrobacter sp. TaxID=263913 RepID=UPI002606DD66|nr:type IV secretion system protein [uncultured Erythrobacter sp.]
MNAKPDLDISDLPVADSWATSVTDDLERSNRRAWYVAIVAALIALLEALALVFLIPLKTVEPYTLLVDRQTGNVEALAPLNAHVVAPDAALTRSFIVQYVIARESFAQNSLQDDYRKVSLWSARGVAENYQRSMEANNPNSPIAFLPRGANLRTEIRSVSNLADNRAMVRFMTTQTDLGGRAQSPQFWVAIVDYEFVAAEMSEADRYINPLGFRVTAYRRDAETLAEEGIVNGIQLPVPNEEQAQ